MSTRTKVICTIGPACSSPEKIGELIRSGMDVARLNFSHGSQEEHVEVIARLKRAREHLGVPLAIMLDTCGPEVRVGQLEGKQLVLNPGERLLLVNESEIGRQGRVPITPGGVLNALPANTRILFDDGYIAMRILEQTSDGPLVEVENEGVLKSRKGVNIPGVSLNLPGITAKDVDDIRFGCQYGVDLIAASFVRAPETIVSIKNILSEMRAEHILVFAKVENHEAVENFDRILQIADGVMIARGDLGVEIPLSQVPRLQKEMTRKCYLAGKPSIIATQMLESMIYHPRPTRAEVSDVANAIYDSASALMLSGETAVGEYPVATVLTMKSIIEETERVFDYKGFLNQHSSFIYKDVPSSVTFAAVRTAYSSDAKAIFAFTSGGGTARLLSRLRPSMPIVVMTPNVRTYHQIALNWGVIPVLGESLHDLREAFLMLSEIALQRAIVSYGDQVIVVGGSTFGIAGTTNMIIVESIGDVLVRGQRAVGEAPIYGNIKILLSAHEGVEPYMIKGQLLVLSSYQEELMPYIAASSGVILQNRLDDEASEKAILEIAQRLGKPALVRADGAVLILKEGLLVTLDPKKLVVYKGVVLNHSG